MLGRVLGVAVLIGALAAIPWVVVPLCLMVTAWRIRFG